MEGFGDRVRRLRLAKGLTQPQLAAMSGLSQTTISDIERGRNKGSTEITKLAEALDTDPETLLSGRIQARQQHVSYLRGGDVVGVRGFNARGSMGPGQPLPANEAITGVVEMSIEWVRSNIPQLSAPRNLAYLTGYGDSMEPTFCDGDVLFIDTGDNAIRIDGLYVFALRDELFIKRIQRIPGGGLKIISDNRARYDPYDLSDPDRESMRVLGRVRWVWNGHKL